MNPYTAYRYFSFIDLPQNERPSLWHGSLVRDEQIIRQRLEELRGQFLQWGTPDLRVFTITKDECRGWIRALEWALGKV